MLVDCVGRLRIGRLCISREDYAQTGYYVQEGAGGGCAQAGYAQVILRRLFYADCFAQAGYCAQAGCVQLDLVRALRDADLVRMWYLLKVIRSSSSADKSPYA